MRATRATELADQYPSHVAAAWLGHTEKIADGHYRQVTSDHLQRATSEPTGQIPGAENLAHFPAHSSQVNADQRSPRNQKSPDIANNDKACGRVKTLQRKCMGIEPTGETLNATPNGFEDRS
jgi:hypothetical protein